MVTLPSCFAAATSASIPAAAGTAGPPGPDVLLPHAARVTAANRRRTGGQPRRRRGYVLMWLPCSMAANGCRMTSPCGGTRHVLDGAFTVAQSEPTAHDRYRNAPMSTSDMGNASGAVPDSDDESTRRGTGRRPHRRHGRAVWPLPGGP